MSISSDFLYFLVIHLFRLRALIHSHPTGEEENTLFLIYLVQLFSVQFHSYHGTGYFNYHYYKVLSPGPFL